MASVTCKPICAAGGVEFCGLTGRATAQQAFVNRGCACAQVDLAYLPFAERFDVGAKEFCDFDMRAAFGGAIGRWLDAMHQRPYAADGSPLADRGLLLSALEKFRSLDFFGYDSFAAAELHPHAR